MEDVLLTTTDNPWNPHTRFDEWYTFDEEKGYHTCSLLARVCQTSEELSDEDQDRIINNAINEILRFNVSGKHTVITASESAPKDELIIKI